MVSIMIERKGQEPTDDGGMAFPCDEFDHGMTLRDYFAGQAIMGYLSVTAENDWFMAQRAYAIADAMLKARK